MVVVEVVEVVALSAGRVALSARRLSAAVTVVKGKKVEDQEEENSRFHGTYRAALLSSI